MAMLLNGRPYADDDILPRERIPVDTMQLIEIFHERRRAWAMGMGDGREGMGMMGGMGMGGHDVDGASDPSARPAVPDPRAVRSTTATPRITRR